MFRPQLDSFRLWPNALRGEVLAFPLDWERTYSLAELKVLTVSVARDYATVGDRTLTRDLASLTKAGLMR